jgi:ribose-phosphate pyrophosphokinase
MAGILVELNHSAGKSTAKKAGVAYCKAELKHFPDEDTYLRIPCRPKGKKVFLLADFGGDPDDVLIDVLLASKTLRKRGAKKVFLIAPYLPYLRQDEEFKKGEAVAGFIVAEFLSKLFDGVASVDPHLHRVGSLSGFFSCRTQKLTATGKIAEHIRNRKRGAVIVGPDIESRQWVEKVAKKAGAEAVVARKKRYSSRKVRVEIGKGKEKVREKHAVLVDDIISTGHTILEAVKALKREKAAKIDCYCVHGIFAEGALQKIRGQGVTVYATNTIMNPAAKIDVSDELAKSVKKWL